MPKPGKGGKGKPLSGRGKPTTQGSSRLAERIARLPAEHFGKRATTIERRRRILYLTLVEKKGLAETAKTLGITKTAVATGLKEAAQGLEDKVLANALASALREFGSSRHDRLLQQAKKIVKANPQITAKGLAKRMGTTVHTARHHLALVQGRGKDALGRPLPELDFDRKEPPSLPLEARARDMSRKELEGLRENMQSRVGELNQNIRRVQGLLERLEKKQGRGSKNQKLVAQQRSLILNRLLLRYSNQLRAARVDLEKVYRILRGRA